MRIITCNVNGLRSAVGKGFWTWVGRQRADILCLQEIRVLPEQLPVPLLRSKVYQQHWFPAARPGYAGVAVLSRQTPDRIQRGFGCEETDNEGRYLQVDFGDLSVVSLYIPSGSRSEARQALKFRFLDRLQPHLEKLVSTRRRLIVCGDYNIAHKEIDLKNWRANRRNSGFLPEERAWMDGLFSGPLVDAFRVVDPSPERYTWWSNRGRAYENNVGWRLDYQGVSPNLRHAIREARIYTDRKFSDHAPLVMDYDFSASSQ